jgi:ABC-type phosphate transport system auxiliary subunit
MEVSSVDSPCLPSALAESMKGRTVTLTKSAGTSEEVPLVILPVHEAQLERHERVLKGILEMLKEFEGEKASAIISLETVVKEAPDELAAAGKGEKGMKLTDLDSFKKAAKTLHDHLEKHMEMHKAHHEKLEGVLAKEHPAVKSSQAMMDHCEKCMKAAKDSMEGEEPAEGEKAAEAGDLSKAAEAQITALQTKFDELLAKFDKLPAPGAIANTGVDLSKNSKTAVFESLLTAN